MIREFRLSEPGTGRGVSCDASGAFVRDIPLLKRCGKSGKNRWEPRESFRLSKQMTSEFGLPIDMSSKAGGLRAIANALNDGDIARAQIATVLLGIPDPPASTKDRRSRERMIKFIRDLDWSGMIKAAWNPDEHPRRPAGAPDSQGGQFAPKGNSAETSVATSSLHLERQESGNENGSLVDVGMSARGNPTRRPSSDLEEQCERQLDSDMYVCGSLRDKRERAICRSSAMERYSACLKGDPLPPLALPEPDNKLQPMPAPAPRFHIPARPPWWLPFMLLPVFGAALLA